METFNTHVKVSLADFRDFADLLCVQLEARLQHVMSIYSGTCQIQALMSGGFSYLPYLKHPPMEAENLDQYEAENRLPASVILEGRCKGHLTQDVQANPFMKRAPNEEPNLKGKKSVVFDTQVFEPYGDVVTILVRDISGVEEVPDDLPEKLPNLEVLDLKMADDLKRLPSSMSTLCHLQYFSISQQSQLQQLPADIGDCESLVDLAVHWSAITKIPTSLGRSKTLQRITLHTLLLREVPGNLGNIHTLVELNLSSNPIMLLPKELGSLKALKILKLSGEKHVIISSSLHWCLAVTYF